MSDKPVFFKFCHDVSAEKRLKFKIYSRLTKLPIVIGVKIRLILALSSYPVERLHVFNEVLDLINRIARIAIALVLLRC